MFKQLNNSWKTEVVNVETKEKKMFIRVNSSRKIVVVKT